jgi:hypothetical protein
MLYALGHEYPGIFVVWAIVSMGLHPLVEQNARSRVRDGLFDRLADIGHDGKIKRAVDLLCAEFRPMKFGEFIKVMRRSTNISDPRYGSLLGHRQRLFDLRICSWQARWRQRAGPEAIVQNSCTEFAAGAREGGHTFGKLFLTIVG